MSFNKKYINIESIKNTYILNGVDGVIDLYTAADALIISSNIGIRIENYIMYNKLNELDTILKSKFNF